ncbi:hypothetical protein SmJEL517_g05492 [Synchytrium microbalum]|uniref:Uncharacterized protein n=1 Tax=Synchytrium microbalum TaxID=1806994 RepID=A0A507BVY4_9FUNG|nr:uncharacterized protein SmJEL517_g05492 [Synchytrium microbalum]TPX31069.1 hypothetical protein SmJEL517_g05492 [Synchytrium microbalum]
MQQEQTRHHQHETLDDEFDQPRALNEYMQRHRQDSGFYAGRLNWSDSDDGDSPLINKERPRIETLNTIDSRLPSPPQSPRKLQPPTRTQIARPAPIIPPPPSEPVAPEPPITPLAVFKEIAFIGLFITISCISIITLPPTANWTRSLYKIGGYWLSAPVVSVLSLIWGGMLNVIRADISKLVSTREFAVICILMVNTYLSIRVIPEIFTFFDQVRNYDSIGFGSMSVWTIMGSWTVVTGILGTLVLGLVAYEISGLVYRIIAPILL